MDYSPEPLEYDRLRALLGRYVRSQAARDLLGEMAPSGDRERLEARHDLVGEAMAFLRDRTLQFPDIPLLPSVMERLDTGRVTLEIPEIEAVQEFVSDIVALRAGWGEAGREFPGVGREVAALPDLGELGRLLGRAIRAGEIREEFSPRLRGLRRDLESARARLDKKLQTILRNSARSGQLQDEIVTFRNGRYVIPIRIEQQRNVAGIVHGSSSSGQTVFMEPLETLDMNNDLVRLRSEEEREVRRILGELTDRIGERREDLARAVGVRAGLELLFGVARWGRDFDCTRPVFTPGEVWLRGARHPLLADRLRETGEGVVPLDIDLPRGDRVLVISGPNAGGKTVVLKTLGLFALMAQSGLPVPAREARVPLSDRVLADIGDQQSISNQLSTFSAHVMAISRMVEEATGDSLILVDEIGSSTEPAEGAALGIAVLEHFRRRGALTLVTTHYNRLKMYAETRPGVRNAAMEFDEETLEPTYRFVQGLVGQSSGLRIAERLRLRKELVEAAWSYLEGSEIEAARFVEQLKGRISGLEADKTRLEEERREFEIWKERWKEGMKSRIEAEQTERLAAVWKRLDEEIDQIRRRAQDSIRGAAGNGAAKLERHLERARRQARASLGDALRAPAPAGAGAASFVGGPSPAPGAPLPVGARVRIRSLGVDGVVLAMRGSGVEVGIGQMKMERPPEDLDLISTPAVRLPAGVHFEAGEKPRVPSELNVIGCSREEALDRLDKFLDEAFLAGFPSVRIVHGSGKGILRRAVADHLEGHPHVSGFELAPIEQGGAGATIARLDN
jgi:DNA mismatch repair protein MutS2